MSKLMRAVYQEYHPLAKQAQKIPEQQTTIVVKSSRFKTICRTVGVSMFSSGMLLFYTSKKEQEKFLCPWWDIKQSPPRLVISGPYQYSRNPMYVAYLMMYTSVGIFFLNSIFLSIPCFGACIFAFNFYNETYIPIEEDKLTRKFGEKYVIYKAITPKWIGFPRSIGPQQSEAIKQTYSEYSV